MSSVSSFKLCYQLNKAITAAALMWVTGPERLALIGSCVKATGKLLNCNHIALVYSPVCHINMGHTDPQGLGGWTCVCACVCVCVCVCVCMCVCYRGCFHECVWVFCIVLWPILYPIKHYTTPIESSIVAGAISSAYIKKFIGDWKLRILSSKCWSQTRLGYHSVLTLNYSNNIVIS